MPADEQPKRAFEPPPWEREAFERFEKERAEQQAQRELEEALRQVREPSPAQEPVVADPEPAAAGDPTATSGYHSAAEAGPSAPMSTGVVLDTQRVNAMLVELKMQEPPAVKVSTGLVNGVIAFLAVTGLVVIVQAVLLFARVRTSEASETMLAATMSFVVLLAGFGFLGGSILLFRKYHS